MPKDKDTLDLWWNAHAMPPIPGAALPEVGFIVPDVAAGFLYQTDSSVAMIENYITNPNSSYEVRQEALDSITGALIGEATERGFERIVALTTAQSIFNRAKRFGFQSVGAFYVLRLDLRD